jgi:hypothetical protein
MPASKPKAAKVIELDFDYDKETKGTHRYAEAGVKETERPIVGTIYVSKAALPDAHNRIHVTIEAVD